MIANIEITEKVEIEELLSYLEKSLSKRRKKEIEQFLLKHPHYFEVLKGLQILKNEFGDKESILSFLKKEGNIIRNNLF